MNLKTRVKAAIRKNLPELKAHITGTMPRFVYGGGIAAGTVPVFVFHEVTSEIFEEKLHYLKENGYSTLDGYELLACLNHPKRNHSKKVVLTFDDGHISLWRDAYPLLKKYDFKAVSFICPGLIPDEENSEGGNSKRILCNWKEIKEMHRSGYVDFQSHGMYHDLVFSSSKRIDFFNPQFSSYYLGKRDKPVILQNEDGFSITNLLPYVEKSSAQLFGMPIFEHAPRYAVEQRYAPQSSVATKMCDFVDKQGGASFFEIKGWRSILRTEFVRFCAGKKGKFISEQAYQNEIAHNLRASKEMIVEKLKGKKVDHICYPWFEAAAVSLETASRSGYALVFLGVDAAMSHHPHLKTLQRCPDKWISLLPGKGRRTIFSTVGS